jgi:heptosyltransferase-2
VLDPKKILVVQTAFLGDVILTLPLVQVCKKQFPSTDIDLLVVPRAAELLKNHPAVSDVIMFDKKGSDAGVSGFVRMVTQLRRRQYQIAFVPHRSLRSAALVAFAGIPRRIGFHKSAGRFFFTQIARYELSVHEVDRNARLLQTVGIETKGKEYPALYPSEQDKQTVDRFLLTNNAGETNTVVGVAPGTVWNTKRWLKERFIELVDRLTSSNIRVVLLGGREDVELCRNIAQSVPQRNIALATGELSLLQSAELIRRCKALVCNDSAPMHLAVAMRTPVVAIFGATVPEFGFAPYGAFDTVIETKGLSCRPCSIHGGQECPITTFDCMVNISSNIVYDKVMHIIGQAHAMNKRRSL